MSKDKKQFLFEILFIPFIINLAFIYLSFNLDSLSSKIFNRILLVIVAVDIIFYLIIRTLKKRGLWYLNKRNKARGNKNDLPNSMISLLILIPALFILYIYKVNIFIIFTLLILFEIFNFYLQYKKEFN